MVSNRRDRAIGMVPRTKVNYTGRDLIQAARIPRQRGAYIAQVTDELRRYLGEPNLLLTPSGRGGLYHILRAINHQRVVVPAFTCKAVVEAVRLAGKTPVFVDTESDGFNVDSASLKEVIDSDSVVVATHQFGIPTDIERLLELCRARNAMVIEDVAAALGTRIDGRLAGTFGDAAFYSFDSTKLLNVPLKGGAVTAKDADFFARIVTQYRNSVRSMTRPEQARLLLMAAALVNIEQHRRYEIFHALNFRLRGRFTADGPKLSKELDSFYTVDLAEWQAFIALPQVRGLDELIARRRQRYSEYVQLLGGIRALKLPPEDAGKQWACIRFPVRTRGDKLQYYRQALTQGIDFGFSFTYIAAPASFVRAHQLARSVLNLPFYTRLTDGERDRVVEALWAIDREAAA